MSSLNYPAIIRQLQKQIAALIAQVGERAEERVGKDIAVAIEVAKLQNFDGTSSKVSRFLLACISR